jgi:hypothetical protein
MDGAATEAIRAETPTAALEDPYARESLLAEDAAVIAVVVVSDEGLEVAVDEGSDSEDVDMGFFFCFSGFVSVSVFEAGASSPAAVDAVMLFTALRA